MAVPDCALADLPTLGLGLGLRNVHFDTILRELPRIDWFEAISENFMDSHGRPRSVLRAVAERYPVVLHGVSLSIGSTDPLNRDYLARLAALADEIQPAWISDHLCWTGILGLNSHDLLPLPLTEESLEHVAARVHQVQDILDRPLIIENPSTYIRFAGDEMAEPEFLRQLCAATGCGLLLDVNNVYVSCFNAGTDPMAYLDAFPFERVVQMHLAGHQNCGTHIIDTHDGPVRDAVWRLFATAWKRTGGAATLLEWDDRIPSLDECIAEVEKARGYMQAVPQGPDQPCRDTGPERLSTPAAFLMPDAMGSVVESV
ncbi:MAG: DUF692 domain-containing protein [Novosphingobium sp.]